MIRIAPRMIVAVLFCLAAGGFAEEASLEDRFEAAAREFDSAALAAVQEAFDAAADAQPEDYTAQRNAAECYAVRAAMNRRDRHIRQLPKAEDKAKRAEQETWGSAGLVLAEKALTLAQTESEKAHAHRLAGELYSHLITGMISGMRNGPKAKRHIEAALALAPKDPECLRAIGIMYLHNPPMSGGDLDKAVESFNACVTAAPKNVRYLVLLAMTHRKREETNLAMDVARKAASLNAKNLDAQHLIAALR